MASWCVFPNTRVPYEDDSSNSAAICIPKDSDNSIIQRGFGTAYSFGSATGSGDGGQEWTCGAEAFGDPNANLHLKAILLDNTWPRYLLVLMPVFATPCGGSALSFIEARIVAVGRSPCRDALSGGVVRLSGVRNAGAAVKRFATGVWNRWGSFFSPTQSTACQSSPSVFYFSNC